MIICQNQNHELSLSSKDPNQDLIDIEVLFPLKLNSKSQNSDVGSLKVQESYPNHDEKLKPQSGTSSFFKAQSRTYRTVIIFASSKWIIKGKNSDQRGLSKFKNYIHLMIKMPNPNQEHPMSSNSVNQNFKDREVLCTFKPM